MQEGAGEQWCLGGRWRVDFGEECHDTDCSPPTKQRADGNGLTIGNLAAWILPKLSKKNDSTLNDKLILPRRKLFFQF